MNRYVASMVLVLVGCRTEPLAPSLSKTTAAVWSGAGVVSEASLRGHGLVRLDDGTVLVVGGGSFGSAGTKVERWNPTTNTWSVAASLPAARVFHSTTLLASGKVLVAGGGVASATIYDPVTNAWIAAATMKKPRKNHTAVRLASGKVLVAAGKDSSSGLVLSDAEVYDAGLDTWTTVGSLGFTSGIAPGAVLLPTGRALVAFGLDAQTFDPVTSTFTPLSPAPPRTVWSLTSLASGKAFSFGADGGATYDPGTNTWTVAASTTNRQSHTAALLPSGKVLLAGGFLVPSGAATTAEIFDPVTNGFKTTEATAGARYNHLAASFAAGVLVVGGDGYTTAERYVAIPDGTTCSLGADCESGACVDGVCCNTPCTGSCAACDVPGAIGTCTAVVGTPHGTRSCGLFATCTSSGCATTCASSADCVASAYCAGTVCAAKKTNGAGCSASGECASAHCVDGVCCDAACGGACEACDATGKVGTCSAITGAPHGTRPACGGVGAGTTCGNTCDGLDRAKCNYPKASAACGVDGCASGIETHVSACDGAGKCSDVATACGAYACGATACKKTCAGTADCAAGFLCSGTTCVPLPGLGEACATGATCSSGLCTDGVCCGVADCGVDRSCALGTPKGTCAKKPAAPCLSSAECGSGACVDGVCCDAACSGQCQACDLPGKLGTCSPVVGAPRGGRPSCDDGKGDPCAARSCDGAVKTDVCTAFAPPSVACRAAACKGDAFVAAASCDGSGSCAASIESSCVPYACTPGGCRARCDSKADCTKDHDCVAAVCKAVGATCTDDRTGSKDKTGAVTPCGAYLCDGDQGTCRGSCTASTDCAAGFACDSTDSRCIPAAPTLGDDGGCQMGSAGGGAWGLLGLSAFAATRRRRRLPRAVRGVSRQGWNACCNAHCR